MAKLTLMQGDCLKLMSKIPDHSINLIIADPPYNKTKGSWDHIIPVKPLWKQYRRIIKDHGAILIFGAEPFASHMRLSNEHWYRYDWIWHKTMPTLFLHSHQRPLSAYENIMVFYKHLPTYNPQFIHGKREYHTNRRVEHRASTFMTKSNYIRTSHTSHGERYPVNIIKFSNDNQYHRLHPTQKPVDLLSYLVRTYTNPNDIVLDNCMGSGSTGIATLAEKRRFIGIEKDPHYFNVASKRIHKFLKDD